MNATIMSSEIYNDYVTDSTIGATTDWLLTFPTKAFHVNADAPVEPFASFGAASQPVSRLSFQRLTVRNQHLRLRQKLVHLVLISRRPRLQTVDPPRVMMCQFVTRPLSSSSRRNQLVPAALPSASMSISMPPTVGQTISMMPATSTARWCLWRRRCNCT